MGSLRFLLFLVLIINTFGKSEEIETDTDSFGDKVYNWFWGPDATITVQGLNASSPPLSGSKIKNMINRIKNIITKKVSLDIEVNVEPLWSKDTNFPPLGLEGILVVAEPFHACGELGGPPTEPTEIEEYIQILDGNLTAAATTNWILLANERTCDLNHKIQNADAKGYSAIVILTGNPQEEIILENTTSQLNIFPALINIEDGLNLAENLSYPAPHTAILQDMRNYQWGGGILKIVLIMIAAIIIIIALLVTCIKVLRSNKDKTFEKEAEEHRRRVQYFLENLPPTIWELNNVTKDEKCHLCFLLYKQNDVIRTMPCYHRFHHRCLFARFDSAYFDCAICGRKIFHEERELTEATPLL